MNKTINIQIPSDLVFKFGGNSLWSEIKQQQDIRIQRIEIVYNCWQYGELRVYFDDSDWPFSNGLLYTDNLFCKYLNDYMRSININTWIDWTEQGMNLSDFCSFGLEKDHMYQIRARLVN